MCYLDTVNHPLFREANKLVHSAEDLLQDMGLTLKEAREWIRAWISGAGDGDGGCRPRRIKEFNP